MEKPKIPLNENDRLNALLAYNLLDTESERIFDLLTEQAALVCETPICLISLIDKDRQWFKSRFGLGATETPRDVSFCGHAINNKEIFYVKDSTKDKRFFDNPLVTGEPHVIFYAGKPLIDSQGNSIGTLCVIDSKPRELSSKQLKQLDLIGEQVISIIQMRVEANKKIESSNIIQKTSDQLPGFIYTYKLNPDGSSSFPFSSNHIYDIYEVTPEEVNKDAAIVFTRIHPNDFDDVVQTINHSATNMVKWVCDYRVCLPNKGERWVRGIANPEKLKDGCILWHGYIHDITDIKLKDELILKNSKLASLGEMAAGIAHEINNPLFIIKGTSQQILHYIDRNELNDEKLRFSLGKIIGTTERVAKIIKGLKFFSSGKSELHFSEENLKEIIDDTISIANEKFKVNNVKINLEFPEGFEKFKIQCHPIEVSQIVLNLMNNAYDAIENLNDRWVKIEIQKNDLNYLISIIDSGPGLSPEAAKKIFEPFFTTKAVGMGTGLGLSIVHGLVKNHNGSIHVDTNSSNTKFVIELPIIQPT